MFSLHINEFEVSVYSFFVSKAEPTKAKANKSKPLIFYRVSVKINLLKNISCCKKMKYFPPSFVYFMATATGLQ